MSETRLALVIFAVQNVVRAARFYGEAFGWQPSVETPPYVELALPGGMRLGLYARERYTSNFGGIVAPVPARDTVSASELYIYATDLEQAMRAALKAGARLLAPLRRRDWGDEVAYFADLDANVLALARPLS